MSFPKYEFHPLANAFALIEGPAFDALVADIRVNGLINDIVLSDDKILDGRNRYRACLAAGVKPMFREFVGTDEQKKAWVIAANVHRRQMETSQLALYAAEIAGRNLTIEEASKIVGVSKRYVNEARRAIKDCTKNVVELIRSGEITLNRALTISALHPNTQRKICNAREADRRLRLAKRRKSEAQKQSSTYEVIVGGLSS